MPTRVSLSGLRWLMFEMMDRIDYGSSVTFHSGIDQFDDDCIIFDVQNVTVNIYYVEENNFSVQYWNKDKEAFEHIEFEIMDLLEWLFD